MNADTLTWTPDIDALHTDAGYFSELAEWLEAHDLDGFKVVGVAVLDDPKGFRWVHALTRTDDGQDHLRVVIPLRTDPPVPTVPASV